MTVVKVNIDMSDLEFRVVCKELLDRINRSDFSKNSDLYKQLVKKLAETPIPFEETYGVLLEKKDSSLHQSYMFVVNEIIKERNCPEYSEEHLEPKYLDDVFKDEILEKIKNEFTLTQIEQMYENRR